MPSIKTTLALLLAFSFTATQAMADDALAPAPAAAATTAPATATPAPTGTVLTAAQVDAVIMQNGFTPLGLPKLKGTMFGSLARIGNTAFIVTVDGMTGQFLDAKPTNVTLPPLAVTTTPAMTAAPAAAAATVQPVPTAVPAMAPAPTNTTVSPVKLAADIARSKGFTVLSFKHVSDDTFIVARRGNGLFNLEIDDKGRFLAAVPIRQNQGDAD